MNGTMWIKMQLGSSTENAEYIEPVHVKARLEHTWLLLRKQDTVYKQWYQMAFQMAFTCISDYKVHIKY